MNIKNIFSFSARWDTAGIDCSFCIYFNSPNEWPDIKQVSSCKLHNISLKCKLDSAGYLKGENFCKNFRNNGEAFLQGVNEFEKIKQKLENKVLYSVINGEKNLLGKNFSDL